MRRLMVLAALWGCNVTNEVDTQSAGLPRALPDDVFTTLKNPADAHAELCDPEHHRPPRSRLEADRITNRFCQDVPGGAIPQPHGLDDLLSLLDLSFTNPSGGNGTGGNPAFRDPRSLVRADRARGLLDHADRVHLLAARSRGHAAARLHVPRIRPGRIVRRGRFVHNRPIKP